MNNRPAALFAGVAAAALCAMESHNASAATPTPSGSATVTEVIVTAEKRTSTVQKTPLSITAISATDLELRGLSSAQDMVQAVPGVSVVSAGPGQAVYNIRGLSSTGGDAPTISFYLDDTPLNTATYSSVGKSEIDPDIYDLQRVEVLRGPQGTLYGDGALGGTIRLITNPPDFSRFYGSAQASLSGTDGGGLNESFKAMINAPIIADKVALRLVGELVHNSGWIDRVVVPGLLPTAALPDGSFPPRENVLSLPASAVYHGVNDEDLSLFRAELKVAPTNALTITPTFLYQRIHQDGLNAYDNPPGRSPLLASYQPFDIAEPFSDTFFLSSVTANYAFPIATLTSATSYWHRQLTDLQDGSEGWRTLGETAFSVAQGGLGPVSGSEADRTSQFSEEVRLASTGSGRLQWIFGGFFSSFWDRVGITQTAPGALAQLGSTDIATGHILFDVREEAGFAHIGYDILPALKFEAGARYFAYQSHFTTALNGGLFGNPSSPIVNATGASHKGVTPTFTLSWSGARDLLLYATAAEGFREGGGDATQPPAVLTLCLPELKALGLSSFPTQYGPDTDWNFEVGEKARLFGGRVTLNSDVYELIWSRVQQFVGLACGAGFTSNGPQAVIKGSEVEFEAKLLKHLTLTQSVGYNYAAYTQSELAAGVVKGQKLYYSPTWTLDTSLRFEHPLTDNLNFVAIAQNYFVGPSEDFSYKLNRVSSRAIANARVGVETDKWSAYIFVNNVLDRHYGIQDLNVSNIAGPTYNRVATNQPLTGGAEVNLKF